MILAYAILIGFVFGFSLHKLVNRTYQLQKLRFIELVFIAVLPQIVVFQLNFTRTIFSDYTASAVLIISQVILILFCLLNIKIPAVWLLFSGLMLNLIVIINNQGFMPISPENANWLVPNIQDISSLVGSRFGYGKDIVLNHWQTNLAILSDAFRLKLFQLKIMFSIGDVFLGLGAFWYMLGFSPNIFLAPTLLEKKNA